ncbi:hypothetical protein SAMD00024442_35_28 [Candidatus Symbiothrix dinenymphae]|nr:hypothetical protein SAMD00024442_35_28 [Candidatus Symbiothrix dinenymphae]
MEKITKMLLLKIAVETCRVVLGITFTFSGFVKAVDPLGTAYKINEYLESWQLSYFDFVSLPVSVSLSVLECSLGIIVLLGIWRKLATWLMLIMMLCLMTPLSMYLLMENPIQDCGCFGDAWIITNLQTFIKNIILSICALFLWSYSKRMTPLIDLRRRTATAIGVVVVVFGFAIYNLLYLPVIDFRPYKIGNNIKEMLIIPPGAPDDEFETTLIYAKDGTIQKFSMENYPKEGSGWEFVDTEVTLLKKGYEAPVHDFTITTAQGEDITQEVLDYKGYTFLMVAHKVEKASVSYAAKLNEIADYAAKNGHHFLGLAASVPEQIASWSSLTHAAYQFCTMDDATLRTIVRSNPGLVLLHDATIVGKWSRNNLPSENKLNEIINN